MSNAFTDLGVSAPIACVLTARGITSPFPIQSLALPPALAGRDICGRAPTGSGKTIAFGIPLAQRVGRGKPAAPRGLVLAPTRELAAQIQNELRPLLSPVKRKVASFYGGVGFGPQLKALRSGVDVVVGCPGRIADLVRRGDLVLDLVDVVVIDEADRMADMGFLPEVKRLLDLVQPDRQTMLFSASLDGAVDVLIKRYQSDPVRCEVAATTEEVDLTSHRFVRARAEERLALTAGLVVEHGSTVIFCRTKHGADRVAGQLQRAGVDAVPIHGGRSQAQRDRALKAFSTGSAQALVATDVAARGIHVDDVSCVVHYDFPADHKDYLHRSGRTGRAGASGTVVSLIMDGDFDSVRSVQRALDLPAEATADLGMPASPSRSSAPSRRSGRPSGGGGNGGGNAGGRQSGSANGRPSGAPGRQFSGEGRPSAGRPSGGSGRPSGRRYEGNGQGQSSRSAAQAPRPGQGPRAGQPRRSGQPNGGPSRSGGPGKGRRPGR
ncbi:MAG: DEAD/DEAH box helicase [Acidimicrobiales bacterium]